MTEILYHASPDKSLIVIEPKRTLSKDKYIGDYVFATSSKKLAAMYLTTKGYATLMGFEDDPPWIAICANPNEYLKNDKGGAIYTLPAQNFFKTPQVGLEHSEVVSKESVKPISKTVYNTSLEAIHEQGINIYFVNQEKFNEIVNSKDQEKAVAGLSRFQKH